MAVCTYLREHTSDGRLARPVFSLRSNDDTVALATKLGGASEQISDAWSSERDHAARRRDSHWAEVQRKQKLALKLRQTLEQQTAELEKLKAEFEAADPGYTGRGATAEQRSNSKLYESLRVAHLAKQREVTSTREELTHAEKAPAPVVQPLPSDEPRALAVLAFLYMPQHLRALAHMSFLAQQALLPRPLTKDDLQAIKVEVKYDLDWAAHHASYHECVHYKPSPRVCAGSQGNVQLKSRFKVPDVKEIGPSHVDHFSSPNDGVWHPDGALELDWFGRNPFAGLTKARMLAAYTEALPEPFSTLQWAMPTTDHADTAATRGNVAVAGHGGRPAWLSKTAFLAFGSLRAFPHLQLRKLCCALRERALPFAHPAVQLLVRQVLYHEGELVGSGDTPTQLAWKSDLLADGGGLLDALHDELASLLDESEDCISKHGTLLLLIDVMTYVCHLDTRMGALRRRAIAVLHKWIAAVDMQVVATHDPASVATLRARQCEFAMYGVLAHGGADAPADEDAASLCHFIVAAHSGYVFEADAGSAEDCRQCAWRHAHAGGAQRASSRSHRAGMDRGARQGGPRRHHRLLRSRDGCTG